MITITVISIMMKLEPNEVKDALIEIKLATEVCLFPEEVNVLTCLLSDTGEGVPELVQLRWHLPCC